MQVRATPADTYANARRSPSSSDGLGTESLAGARAPSWRTRGELRTGADRQRFAGRAEDGSPSCDPAAARRPARASDADLYPRARSTAACCWTRSRRCRRRAEVIEGNDVLWCRIVRFGGDEPVVSPAIGQPADHHRGESATPTPREAAVRGGWFLITVPPRLACADRPLARCGGVLAPVRENHYARPAAHRGEWPRAEGSQAGRLS